MIQYFNKFDIKCNHVLLSNPKLTRTNLLLGPKGAELRFRLRSYFLNLFLVFLSRLKKNKMRIQ